MMSVEKVMPGIAGPERRHDFEIPLAGIATEHPPQHGVRAALHRQVYVLADGGAGGHRLQHARREVGGIWTGEPDPADTGHRIHGPQQVGEVVLAVVIRVDRLTEEGDLAGALVRHPFRFAHYVGEPAAPLGPPGVRHDAEGAPVIAAALHRNEAVGPFSRTGGTSS